MIFITNIVLYITYGIHYLLVTHGPLCKAHFASIVQDFLKQEKIVLLPHPLYLPDLALFDFFLVP